ncbi:uncharacterized protein VTP21DRAFT_11686 [Calcarisporiella thermophila]|uniref:uncharacterized protein n=1 Tax=Calcarisporiella thermophila TaxID=911321 RepID=UPI003744916A
MKNYQPELYSSRLGSEGANKALPMTNKKSDVKLPLVIRVAADHNARMEAAEETKQAGGEKVVIRPILNPPPLSSSMTAGPEEGKPEKQGEVPTSEQNTQPLTISKVSQPPDTKVAISPAAASASTAHSNSAADSSTSNTLQQFIHKIVNITTLTSTITQFVAERLNGTSVLPANPVGSKPPPIQLQPQSSKHPMDPLAILLGPVLGLFLLVMMCFLAFSFSFDKTYGQ